MNFHRLKIIFFIFFSCFILQTALWAQNNVKITLQKKNITLQDAFQEIEKQSNYLVAFNESKVNKGKNLNLDLRSVPLEKALSQILSGTGFSYKIKDNYIMIVPASKPTAEKKELNGVVKDEKGEPLIGVNIRIKGSAIGAITDIDGNFKLQAEKGSTLVVSYTGYTTKEVSVGNEPIANIILSENLTELNEVVVTALGIKKETKALTYNVQEIKASELSVVKDANFMNTLAGKIAGVTINTSSSGVGGSARVVMRGTKSIAGNNNALYVVDGIPLPSLQSTQPSDLFTGMGQSGDGISAFNTDDIESMSVLSGAAAAALYGSEAANGVVMITTKKGQKEKLSVNVSNSTTFNSPFILPKFQNTYGSKPGAFESWGDKLDTPSSYDPADFFQTGYNTMNSISLSTGSEKNQSYFSASMVNARGIIPNNDLSRYNLSFRNTSTLLNDKLDLDFGVMYMNVDEQNMLSQGQYFNPLIPIYLFPRSEDINRYITYERYNSERNFKTQYWPFGDMGLQMQNPYWIINRDMFNNGRDRYLINAALKYKLTDWMNITVRGKMDNAQSLNEKKYYATTSGLFAEKNGSYHRLTIDNKQKYGDIMLNINKYIGDFSVTAVLGASVSDIQNTMISVSGHLQSVANLFTLDNMTPTKMWSDQSSYHDQTQAIFATAQVGYKSMVYLDVTARNDWASNLAGTKSNSIFYPSIGLSGILTDMLPIKSDVLSFLKVRASYSEVGNAPMRYISIATYPMAGGFPQTTTFKPDKNFRPERTKSTELGVNARLFGNKINFDLTLYKSSTYNQLFNPTLPPSSGYNSVYINAGRIDNQGIEASLGLNQNLGPVEWSSKLTYSLNRNKIKQLLPETDLGDGIVVDQRRVDMGGTGSYKMILTEGGSMGDIYVNCLKQDSHGKIYVGSTSYSVIPDPDNYIKAGNANPDYTLGWRNDFEWKGLTLGCMINARIGGVGVSVTQSIMDYYGVSETSAKARDLGGVMVNDIRIPAKSYYQVVGAGTSGIGSPYVYDATNIRLAELSLGYNLPINKWCKWIKGANISLVGRNLFMIYCKAPFDPESTASTGTYYQGVDYFMQPSLRSIGFAAKFNF